MHGPKYMGGEALFHFYDDQGYGQVRMFLKFWRTPTTQPGKLLRATYAWAQFCAGVGWSILSKPETPLKYLESVWLASLRHYLASIRANIELTHPFLPEPQRENDVFLMDVAIRHAKFRPVELRRINYCRMFLNVVLLSDITTAGGDKIETAMYHGNPQESVSTTTHHEVTQSNPNGKAWKAWRKLMHLFCNRHTLKLKHDYLGAWLVPREQQRRQWPILYDPDGNHIYCQVPTGWTKHEMMYYDYDGSPSATVTNLPATAVPCDFSTTQHTIRVDRYEARQLAPAQPTSHSIQDLIQQLEPWEVHLLSGLEFLTSEQDVWQALASTACIFASDGSAPQGKGSFAWILSDLQGNRMARCSGPVFGHKIGSYRSEGYGILSVLRFLLRMKEIHTHPGDPRSHSLKSDSKSMIQVIHKHKGYAKIFPNATMASEWDVIAEILTTMKALTNEFTPELSHVKGHQDRDKPYDKLSLSAQLNVDADKLADEWIQAHPDYNHRTVPILPTAGSQLHVAGGTATHNLKLELKLARTEEDLKSHYCDKFEWEDSTFNDVDWSGHGRAIKYLDKHRKTLVKYLNSFTPVGVRVHRYDKKYPRECPSCNHPLEDSHHLIHCHRRKDRREKWYQAIFKYTTDSNTYLPLQELIMSAMRARLDDQPDTAIEVPHEVQQEAMAQSTIGWRHLFKGRLSKSWTARQDQHLDSLNQKSKDNNGDTWMAGLIEVMFQQYLELWAERNSDPHGKDWEASQAAKKRQAIREVTQLYEQYKDNIQAEDNWLFDLPLLERIQHPTAAIRQWINSWQTKIKESYQTRLETG